jgi:hypothetical protein
MNSEQKQRPLESLELVATHAEKQLDSQWDHWDQVDGRLRLLLGFVGAIFVATLAFANSASDTSSLAKALLISAIVVLIVSGIIATAAWSPRKFDRPPNPAVLRDKYLTSPRDETRLVVLDTMLEAYNENQRRIDEKLVGFRNAMLVLGIAIVLIAVAGIIEIGR